MSDSVDSAVRKLYHLAQSKKLSPPISERPLLIRAFVGGDKAVQDEHFTLAWRKVEAFLNTKSSSNSVKLETLTFKEIREAPSFSLRNFVDWLLGSHIHIITTHIHLGIRGFDWGVRELDLELERLRSHVGFPSGEKLSCPIFTQDKIRYLNALAPGQKMTTFCLNLSDDIDDVRAEVEPIIRKWVGLLLCLLSYCSVLL